MNEVGGKVRRGEMGEEEGRVYFKRNMEERAGKLLEIINEKGRGDGGDMKNGVNIMGLEVRGGREGDYGRVIS